MQTCVRGIASCALKNEPDVKMEASKERNWRVSLHGQYIRYETMTV